MARPQEHPGIGHALELPTGAFELVRHSRAPDGESIAYAGDMLAEVAADEHLMQYALGEGGRRQRDEQLHARERGDRIRIGNDEPDTQARRQRLAVTAEIERALESIERREPRRRIFGEVGEDVVLDDVEPMPGG